MKKITALLLLLLLVFCGIPFSASADEAGIIEIRTVSDWNAFAKNCTLDSWSAGKEVVLSADLDFKGTAFAPAPLFAGHFNGNGHKIEHIRITEAASTFGLFRQILGGALVENLQVNGSYTPAGTADTIGGIAGRNYGTIRNCSFSGTIEAIRSAGGICGINDSSALIENCTSTAFVSAQHRSGGICGENAGTVTGSTNRGQVNTEAIENVQPESPALMLSAEELIDITDIGGIAGISSGVLSFCQNFGNVGYPRIGYNIGGIAGRQSGFTSGCLNSGTVLGRKDAGGITGQLDPDTNWDLSESNLLQLQGMLGGLKDSIHMLIADAQYTGDAVSAEVQNLLSSLSGLGEAAGSFIQNLDHWLKLNIDSSIGVFGEGAVIDENTIGVLVDLMPDLGLEVDVDVETGDYVIGRGALESLFSLSADAGFLGSSSTALLTSLRNIQTSLSSLAGIVEGSPLLDDIRIVSDQLFAVSDFITGMFQTPTSLSSYSYVRDISDHIQDRSAGVICDCSNTADIKADTNTGGIIGAISIDFAFDREDELNLSAVLSGGAKYLIFAAAQNCVNAADVTADKNAAGGIAGRMDYGILLDCEASGSISAKESYAGGVAGYSKGTIDQCRARAGITAESYEGGIAGYAAHVLGCFAMPDLKNSAEYRGSVAGFSEGTAAGNFYAESDVGGIDGFSFEGAAKELSYEELLSCCPRNTIFQTITLSFMSEDGGVQEISVPFGGEIKNLPSVPDRDGLKWKWDDFDRSSIYHSMTIEGHYVDRTGTLATEEDVPTILVEGVFYEGQKLTVTPYTKKIPVTVRGKQELFANTVTVEDYSGPLLIRMRAEQNGDLYLEKETGRFQKAQPVRDGSYLVFEAENGKAYAFIASPDNTKLWIICSVLLALILADTLAMVLLKRKEKREEALVSGGLEDVWNEIDAELLSRDTEE